MIQVIRWLPLAIIMILLLIFFYCGFHHLFNLSTLVQYRKELLHLVQNHYFSFVMAYILVFIFTVTISFPSGALLTVFGGFLFNVFPGIIYVEISATIGACLLFLAIRTSVGHYLERRNKGWIAEFEDGFRQNAWHYLFFLRLIPFLPFGVVNIIPALMNIPLFQFFSATVIGIMPISLLYLILGRDIGVSLASDQIPGLELLIQPKFIIPVLLLTVLALISFLYRNFRMNKLK